MRRSGLDSVYALLIGLALIGGLVLPVEAQTDGGTGILKIKPGDLASGMGQAGVALDQGWTSLWWNPALLVEGMGVDAGATLVKLVPDLADDVWYLNAGYRQALGEHAGIAASLMYLSYGRTEATDSDGISHGFFSSYEVAPVLGVGARAFTVMTGSVPTDLDVGLALKYVRVRLAPEWAMQVVGIDASGSASALGADIGLATRTIFASGRDFSAVGVLGMNVQNLGGDLSFGGSNPDPLPRNLKAGLGINVTLGEGDLGDRTFPLFRMRGAYDVNHSLIDYPERDTFEGRLGFGWSRRRSVINYGVDNTKLDCVSVRRGRVVDRDGEIVDWTMGVGVAIDLGVLGRLTNLEGLSHLDGTVVEFAWSRIPQALGLSTVNYFHVGLAFASGGDEGGSEASGESDSGARFPGTELDSDGDGVPDSADQEPNTLPGTDVDRHGVSIDDDGDGVPNGIDREPLTRQGMMVDQYGVQIDLDHDGVGDSMDRCLDTPAELAVDSLGCPIEVTIIEEKLISVGQFEEQRIYFATADSTLLPESFSHLGVIGLALSDLPELRFEVGGHCDDRGTDEFNQRLSEARARAVVDYLVGKFAGVAQAQFEARGFGKTRPVAVGTDEASRALNRRVEFVVLNREAARQQVERKRYLQRGEAPPSSPAPR